jgi:hypothetical protein
MKWLERLKTIGIDLSKLTSIKLLNLNVNIDRSVHVDIPNAKVEINPERLNGKQRRALQGIIRDGLLESGVILASDQSDTVDAVRAELPTIQSAVAQFQNILPPADLPLLRACLYLRQRYREGRHVDDLKAQITGVYGQRGGNFANLCSAGYLEDWFLPLHQELSRLYPDDPVKVKSIFLNTYTQVVNELPWTFFVCSSVSKAKTTEAVIGKLKRNQHNGIHFMNLHGLGAPNTKKIESILPDIQSATGAVVTRREQELTRIFVRLEMPDARP